MEETFCFLLLELPCLELFSGRLWELVPGGKQDNAKGLRPRGVQTSTQTGPVFNVTCTQIICFLLFFSRFFSYFFLQTQTGPVFNVTCTQITCFLFFFSLFFSLLFSLQTLVLSRCMFCIHHTTMHQFTVSLLLKPHADGAYAFSCQMPPALLAE